MNKKAVLPLDRKDNAMKLSMWIIANLLESFEPEVHIRRESPRVLRSARLAYATDCVLVQQDGSDCLYLWNEDSIRLPDLSAREGFRSEEHTSELQSRI